MLNGRLTQTARRSGIEALCDLIAGGGVALVIGALDWLSVAAVAPQASDASVRAFGTLLTVLFGIVSAGAVSPPRTGLRIGVAAAGRTWPQAARDRHSAWAAECRTL